eukprot:364362-Chlamydomonas_euryale.AAC.17
MLTLAYSCVLTVEMAGAGADPEGYACVERSKAEWIRQQTGCCHKWHATAHGPEVTTPPRQPGRENRAANAPSRHMERGLPNTPPRPTSPSANNSCLTTDSSCILATCPRHETIKSELQQFHL